MKRRIELDKNKIEYTLRTSKRARCLRLSVRCDGNLVVTAPQYLSENAVEQFILQKSKWIIDKLNYFKSMSDRIFFRSSKKDYLENKGKALILTKERIEHFNTVYGLKFNKISIKNQKTRWGSCSRKGNLNFNYKIALIPEKLADYVIVHELCHLKEFNHSAKFWKLVSITMPDYLKLRKELKKS